MTRSRIAACLGQDRHDIIAKRDFLPRRKSGKQEDQESCQPNARGHGSIHNIAGTSGCWRVAWASTLARVCIARARVSEYAYPCHPDLEVLSKSREYALKFRHFLALHVQQRRTNGPAGE